jgi:hypothetical protein
MKKSHLITLPQILRILISKLFVIDGILQMSSIRTETRVVSTDKFLSKSN